MLILYSFSGIWPHFSGLPKGFSYFSRTYTQETGNTFYRVWHQKSLTFGLTYFDVSSWKKKEFSNNSSFPTWTKLGEHIAIIVFFYFPMPADVSHNALPADLLNRQQEYLY